jgi:hypothetical protein
LPGIGASVGKGEVELKLLVRCAEARSEKLAMQLAMMDFILCDEIAVVEGWLWFSRKGRVLILSSDIVSSGQDR